MPDTPRQEKNTMYCSFCGKSDDEVKTLIAGPDVFICDECIDVCIYAFRDEGKLDQLSELKNVGIVPARDEINIEKLGLKPRFQKLSFDIKKKNCIYLCPFSEPFNSIYEDHVRQAVEAADHTIFRVDEIFGTGPIIDDIWEGIVSSEFVIADVTGKNPNVMYEIGMAHTIGKPVVIITQNIEDVPFDLRHYRCILYDYTPRGCKDLEKKISGTLKFLKS